MVVGEPIPQPMRDREHPLPHRNAGREDVLDYVCGALGHPPAATARAEAASLAAEGHPSLEGAVFAAHASKAMRQHPAA